MKLEIQIRKIEEKDLDFIYNSTCELQNEIFDFEVFMSIFIENISNKNNLYLIANVGTENLGYISFHTQKLMHHCGIVGEIQEFYIKPNHRNKGIGKQLLENIISYADQHKLKSIEVTTNKKRIENVLIYENLGFNLSHNKFTIYKTE